MYRGGNILSNNRLFAMALMLLVPVLALGCAPETKAEVPVTLTCDELSAQKNIVKDMDVQIGNKIIVTLCSNKTTGFSWTEKAQISDPQVIEQTAYNWVAPKDTGGRVGVAGNEVWTFKALAAGKSTVYLQYSQPWTGGAKATWTFKLNLNVK
jgi:inhibitor of cysteine peptidase